MPDSLDSTMQQASEALARMDYLTCEALCLEALASARSSEQWSYYARILMPLQECRRQRRMIACDAGVFTDTTDVAEGVIVFTPPHTAESVDEVDRAMRQSRRHVEVLFVSDTSDTEWTVRAHRGAGVAVAVTSPPNPIDVAWFLRASEALGDAAIAQVQAPLGSSERVIQLEKMLNAVTDHEKLHQRLGDAARAMTGLLAAGSPPNSHDTAAGASPAPPPVQSKRKHGCLIGCVILIVLLLTGCLIAATIAGRMWSAEPDHWQERKSFVADTSTEQLEQLAAGVQNRLPSVVSQPGDEPRTITLGIDEANAWLDQRLDDWLAHQGAALPSGMSEPMLATAGEQIIFAFRIEAEGTEQIVSVYFNLGFEPAGQAVLLVDRVELGSLQVPASTLAGLLETTQAPEAAAVLRGEHGFDPASPIDGNRQVRLLGIKVHDDRLELEVVNESRTE